MGVGIAVTRSLLRYRVAKLKAMGCNAYRCAHNCPSRELLEICDDLGMMVMAENRHYRSSEEVMRQLDELTLLDTRAVTAAMNGGVLTRRNASDVLDAAGMNYFIDDYMTYARRRPGHPMVGTENGPLYATRGIYKDDPKAQVYDSYGLTTAPFGQRLQETMEAVEAAPHVASLFVWGGFDYRGEPQPFEWPSVFSHWGLMDNCGFEKDTFYLLKSYYSDPNQRMVHLLPHWNWSEGERVRVCAMTNCDSAKLFLNGREVGEGKAARNRVEWQIPFEPGALRVEAYGDGEMLADEVRTAGLAAALEVVDAASAEEYDSSIINVRLMDENGVPVPGRDADRLVRFEVKCGEIIGAGNGDPNGIQPNITDKFSPSAAAAS